MNVFDICTNILAKITGLEGILNELKAGNANATSALLAKDEAIASLTSTNADLQAKLDEAPKPERFAELTAKATEFEEYKASEPKRINEALAVEIAKFGVPPITPAQQGNAPELSAAEFNTLSHAKRNEYIRNGGKISKQNQP